jgi:hypothetical protein
MEMKVLPFKDKSESVSHRHEISNYCLKLGKKGR